MLEKQPKRIICPQPTRLTQICCRIIHTMMSNRISKRLKMKLQSKHHKVCLGDLLKWTKALVKIKDHKKNFLNSWRQLNFTRLLKRNWRLVFTVITLSQITLIRKAKDLPRESCKRLSLVLGAVKRLRSLQELFLLIR